MSSGHEWSIDEIVHALPTPELRAKARTEMDLARGWQQLQAVRAKWETFAANWVNVEAPKIAAARAYNEQHGEAPPEFVDETTSSRSAHQAWRERMQQARRDRGAA